MRGFGLENWGFVCESELIVKERFVSGPEPP